MTSKAYSKHREYKEYSSSAGGVAPYGDEQFDMLKSELIPKNSKLNSLGRDDLGAREYHYEYREEKHPSGKYDRKDLHTVEEYTIPPKSTPKSKEKSSYYYEREERELPAITSSSSRTYNYDTSNSTPGYSSVKSSKASKGLSHNVEELDSLLDDLQRDQERQLYKSGYASDTAESTSFDYKRGTPAKAPSSGYSTLKHEERMETSSWRDSSPQPPPARHAEIRQEVYREEKTESRVIPSQVSPALPLPVPAPVCTHCHQPPVTGTLPRSGTPMNKVTTTVKTYTYEVPADQDPTTVPLPQVATHETTYLSTNENLRSTTVVPPAPSSGCQHCSHCNSRLHTIVDTRVTNTAAPMPVPIPVQTPAPPPPQTHSQTTTTHYLSTSDDRTNERIVYPRPANEVVHTPHAPHAPHAPHTPTQPRNGHGPYSPSSYKYSETTYSRHDTTERYPVNGPSPPAGGGPAPFPRPSTPSPGTQQPPKQLDELMADFPDARFPTQPDGLTRRKVEVTHESSKSKESAPAARSPPIGNSKNVAGPGVYYPPGHTPFAKKETAAYQASAMQGGGAYASGRGMYEYESGSRSKEKHSEKKMAVPLCLPLCCAMPCVIM